MTIILFLAATGVVTYYACRHLARLDQPDRCPRGGTHQTVTPAGDVAPCCVACGRMTKGDSW